MSISTLSELIERLRSIREDIRVPHLSPAQYQQVGWAVRPLDTLLDQCREEAESLSWAQLHAAQFSRVLPKAAPSSVSKLIQAVTGETSG